MWRWWGRQTEEKLKGETSLRPYQHRHIQSKVWRGKWQNEMLSEEIKQWKDNMPLQKLATVEVTPPSHLGFTCMYITYKYIQSHTLFSLLMVTTIFMIKNLEGKKFRMLQQQKKPNTLAGKSLKCTHFQVHLFISWQS